MFRFTRTPSSGSHSQYLAKITHLVQSGYIEVVQTLSVLWLHPCKPKHVEAASLILKCFNNSTFLTLCALVGHYSV
jgi:hypothetical protein